METNSQNKSVQINLPLGSSAFAVATDAKQGIVVILNAIKEIKPAGVTPVAAIIATISNAPSSLPSPPAKSAVTSSNNSGESSTSAPDVMAVTNTQASV